MRVLLTGPAKKALDNIYEHLRRKGYGMAGRRVRASVLKKAMLLKDHPYLGPVEEHLVDLGQGHRSLVEGSHKIIYFIDDKTVFVTDIFDTRQDPDKMKG